ncbi:putative Enkurin [Hypsibius exemplaris]|uniref:Enkurin n=1 Tax=Hypsibius exemplaris TaxID=2072580 RepID=A0A1W0WCX6_HYPEX|nr:putative Enkurin [Hypsibius exemplaris]
MYNSNQRKAVVPSYQEFFVESVYNLRPTVAAKVIRPPRYVSQYSVPLEAERQKPKRSAKTFGLAHLSLPGPGKFLRKTEPEPPCRPPLLPRKICYDIRRGVPQRNEWNPTPVRPLARDMVVKTKQKVLAIQPKVPALRTVDRRTGSVQVLEPAGLTGKYIFKENYGKVPTYVKKYEKTANDKKKNELFAARGAELVASQSHFRWVSEAERECVLKKLQDNFDDAMHEFQALSVSLDNQTKIKTKALLERKLNELEKTISTVKGLKKIVIKLETDV